MHINELNSYHESMCIASLWDQIFMTDLRTIWLLTRSIYYWIYRPDGEQKMKGWLTWHEVIIWSSRQNIIAETGYYKIAKIPGSTCIGVCVCAHMSASQCEQTCVECVHISGLHSLLCWRSTVGALAWKSPVCCCVLVVLFFTQFKKNLL